MQQELLVVLRHLLPHIGGLQSRLKPKHGARLCLQHGVRHQAARDMEDPAAYGRASHDKSEGLLLAAGPSAPRKVLSIGLASAHVSDFHAPAGSLLCAPAADLLWLGRA